MANPTELIRTNFSRTYEALLAQTSVGAQPRIPTMPKTAEPIHWSETWFIGDRKISEDGKTFTITPSFKSVVFGMVTCGFGTIGAILHGLYVEHKQKMSASITTHIQQLGLHNGNKRDCSETTIRQENETPHWLYHQSPNKAGLLTEIMQNLKPDAKKEKPLSIDMRNDSERPKKINSNLTGSQVSVYVNTDQMICYNLPSTRNSAKDEIVLMHFKKYVVLNKNSLKKADLDHANLSDTDLSNAKLSNAWLTDARLLKAKLINADLTYALLGDADLTGADLTGADLTGADLAGATLTGADLRGANLTGATLTGAKLEGAKLEGAKLEGADLTRTILKDTDLRDAINVNLTGAITDDQTLLYHSVE